MNLQAIYIANFTGFILILFLFISRFITQSKSQAEDHIFNVMMILAIVSCLVEPLTFFVDGKPGMVCYWVNLLGNTYLYSSNGIGSFLWCVYVDRSLYHDPVRAKKIYNKFGAVVLVILCFLFGNIWGGYFFYVDDANVYHRQPLINGFYVYMMFCCVFSIVVYERYRRRHGRVAFFPIYMYLIPIVSGSVLQMLYFGVSLAWLGTAIGIVALYMSLLNQRSYMDQLTGLYNRLYMEHAIYGMQRGNASYYGIMLDMNFFKKINDTYGHSVGDQALKDAAAIFRTETDNRSTVFRYAGDEFIILMKTGLEQEVETLEKALRDAADRFNATGERPYQLSFSMGHDRFERELDNEDSFLKKIDAAMYLDKTRMHEALRLEEESA